MLLFVAKLNKELSAKLNKIHSDESDKLVKYQRSIEYIKDALIQLKLFMVAYSFKNREEEIHFFKVVKPELLSKLIYYVRILNIEIRRPIGGYENQKKHLCNELEKLTTFFNSHVEFYQYYRMSSSYLDEKYFTRGMNDFYFCQDCLTFYSDTDFSSSHDFLVANIKANDQVETYLKNELEILSIKEQNPNWGQLGISGSTTLQWTDSKTALVELIYALYSTGSINSGKTEIRELTAFFEQAFNIKLPDIYRTYLDIKIRSTPTKYIDTLKTALMKKIEEDL